MNDFAFDHLTKHFNFAGPRGPYQLIDVEYSTEGYFGIMITRGQRLRVMMKHLFKVRPPKPTPAEKEKAVYARDKWRQIRDELLSKTFKPEPRQKPTPTPRKKPSPKSVDLDWNDSGDDTDPGFYPI